MYVVILVFPLFIIFIFIDERGPCQALNKLVPVTLILNELLLILYELNLLKQGFYVHHLFKT